MIASQLAEAVLLAYLLATSSPALENDMESHIKLELAEFAREVAREAVACLRQQALEQPRLNTDHAAALLGINAKTLANWRSLNRGPRYEKIGRRVVYRRSDLEAYARQSTGGKTSSEESCK